MTKLISKNLKINIKNNSLINVFNFDDNFSLKLSKKYFTFALLLVTFAFILSPPIFAQLDKDDYPKDVVPPPLNFISKSEKKQLKAETKMKKRIKLSLELMDMRLINSKKYLEKNEFHKSLNEIGKFRGLLINTLKYLKTKEGNKGSLKNFKKLELSLRSFIPRLETLRREMPYKYGYHVKRTMFFVRDSRTKALSPLFDDTVLSEKN